MKRRLFLILLALLVTFSLSACAQKPSENGDWIWTGSNGKEGVLTADGYYFVALSNKNLCYADLDGGGCVILCSKVGCPHDGMDCEAHVSTFRDSPLVFWNDHIYYVDEVNTGVLYRRDATGMALMEIGIPGQKYLEEGKSCKITAYAQAGGYMYYCSMVSQPDQDATGAGISLKESCYIGRINLTNGKDEILVEASSLVLHAVREGGVLFSSSAGVGFSRDDPGYAEAYRQMPVTLSCWSEETGEIKELFTKTRGEYNQIQLVSIGKLYYSTPTNAETGHRGNLYAYDLDTGKEELVSENAFFTHYGGGYALRKVDDEEGYLLYNLKTGEALPKETTVPILILTASSDHGCVVKRHNASEDPDKGGETWYCYLAYDSLADGLQESDFVLLYTQKMGYS